MQDIFFVLIILSIMPYLFYMIHKEGVYKVSYWRMMTVLLVTAIPPTLFIILAGSSDTSLLIRCFSSIVAIIWLSIGLLYAISLTHN
jgi:uncharacterized membrane protein YdjX (TVP38/TMEM64 family)